MGRARSMLVSKISSCVMILEACVRSHLLYSAQSWELTASELNKLETIWHGFLRKIVANGFKHKNVLVEYLKESKDAKKSNVTVPEPDDLNWSFVYNNSQLQTKTKTKNITMFCKIQHLKYIAHVTRLDNGSFKNNSFSPVNLNDIPVTVGQKLKKNLEYVKCKSRRQCKIKKSSCLYFTTLFRKDTLRVLTT